MPSGNFKHHVFIRHKFNNIQPSTYRKFVEDRVIVLDYEKVAGSDPTAYADKTAKNAMQHINRYCKEGALVGADYREINAFLVGEIEPNTEVKTAHYDGYDYYKTVKLKNARSVNLIEYPVLLSKQPRLGTMKGWESAGNVLEAIYYGRSLQLDVYNLGAEQLEVLCYEYLKKEALIDTLLMSIGRTLKDVDILGLKGNSNVIAQVTFSSKAGVIQEKIADLLKHNIRSDDHMILFCPAAIVPKPAPASFTCYAIEDVFRSFDPGSPFIKRLFHLT